MKITPFSFEQHPQFTIDDLFKNGYKILLNHISPNDKKGFFEEKSSFYKRTIIKNSLHLRLFSCLFVIKEAREHNFFNAIEQCYVKDFNQAVTDVLLSLFDCYFYKNAIPLNYALNNLSRFLNNGLYKKLKEHEEKGWFDIYYNENFMMKLLFDIKYVEDNSGYLGTLYSPKISRNKKGELIVEFLSDVENEEKTIKIENKQSFEENKNQSDIESKAKEFKESFKDDISLYPNYKEEEKIIFIEEYLNENVHTAQSDKLIKELKKLYRLNHKYNVTDNLINHDYKKLLDKDFYNLLKFLDIYKNEENEGINLQIDIIYKLTKGIKEKIFNEVDDLLNAKNRYLQYKLKEIY